MLLPGGAPLGGGYTDQLRTTAGAPEAPSPWQKERLSNRWGQEGGFGGGHCPQGERWGNKGYIRAGGEQTVHIITLSSGMEREKQGGRAKER